MRYTTLPFALLLLGIAAHTRAQTKPTKAPAPLTLAQALIKMPLPTKGVLLAVGADKVALPDGTPPPPADAPRRCWQTPSATSRTTSAA